MDAATAVLVGVTARPEAVDRELLQNGRFSTRITLSIASASQRQILLQEIIPSATLDADAIRLLAGHTHSFNASDLHYLYTEAFRIFLSRSAKASPACALEGGGRPTLEHFQEALARTRPTATMDMPLVRTDDVEGEVEGGGGFGLVGVDDIQATILVHCPARRTWPDRFLIGPDGI